MSNQKTIGEIIYANRKKAGISQEELADMLEVSRQSVSLWETDQTAPSTANLVRLTEIFNISMDELCGKDTKPNTTPAETDEDEAVSDCLAKVQTVYDRADLKKAYNDSYRKIRAIAIVAIILSVVSMFCMMIDVPSTQNPTQFIVVAIFIALLAAGKLISLSVQANKLAEEDLKRHPKITVAFYHDRFETESVTDNSTAKYKWLYSDVTRVHNANGLLLIYTSRSIVPIHTADLGKNANVVYGLLRTPPPSNVASNKHVKRLLLSMFVLSLASISLALLSSSIAMVCSPLPDFPNSMLEYIWVFYLFIPVPVASAILGAVFLVKKYKCKKNIIAGIIMAILLAIYGSMAPMTGIEVKHDFEFIQSIGSELPIELPNSGYVSYTLYSNDAISAEAMLRPSDKNVMLDLIERDNWLSKKDFSQSNVIPRNPYLTTLDYDYFYLYDLDCDQANSQISGEHGEHDFIYLAYLQKRNVLHIFRFRSDAESKSSPIT